METEAIVFVVAVFIVVTNIKTSISGGKGN
jgi:hypothetical protein